MDSENNHRLPEWIARQKKNWSKFDLEIVRRRRYFNGEYLAFGSMVVGTVLALLIPESGAQGHPLLEWFVQRMQILVPTIADFAELSTFPEVTRLYLSIIWFTFPLQVFAWVWSSVLDRTYMRREIVIGICFIVMTVLFIWFCTHDISLGPERLDGDRWHDLIYILVSRYKFFLGLIGATTVSGLAWFAGLSLRLIGIMLNIEKGD